MTETEIKQEVNAQVRFKMNELLTGIRNRVAIKHQQAFDMSHESQYAWKAFEELETMVRKEIAIATPLDRMANEAKRKAKNIAVENIERSLDLTGRPDYVNKIRVIVAEIEKAQSF